MSSPASLILTITERILKQFGVRRDAEACRLTVQAKFVVWQTIRVSRFSFTRELLGIRVLNYYYNFYCNPIRSP
jgi:hypothetical protein